MEEVVGVEPTVRESKSRALPFGDTPVCCSEIGLPEVRNGGGDIPLYPACEGAGVFPVPT